jgi:hydrogenase large subunit
MVKVHTIFGGKNPHPNYLVGGAPCSFNLDENNAINAERLAMVGRLFEKGKEFIEKVYIPDLLAVASFYKDWSAIGGGLPNYLAYGDLPTNGYNHPRSFKFPRGALAHWIAIKDRKIDNYQLVVPSTWNASPRDTKGQMSAYESAPIGTPIANPEMPLEVLRTIHSFDPCIACAVHLHDEHGTHVHQVRVF